jgi:hypothetical protein
VRLRLAETLTGLREVHPDIHVLTGLTLGAPQLAAEAAILARVPTPRCSPTRTQKQSGRRSRCRCTTTAGVAARADLPAPRNRDREPRHPLASIRGLLVDRSVR